MSLWSTAVRAGSQNKTEPTSRASAQYTATHSSSLSVSVYNGTDYIIRAKSLAQVANLNLR